jgi:hypothetical protein
MISRRPTRFGENRGGEGGIVHLRGLSPGGDEASGLVKYACVGA